MSGSDGCTRVNTRGEMYGDYFMVDHTSNTTEPIAFEFEDVTPDEIQNSSRRVIAENIEARNSHSVTSALAIQEEREEESGEEPILPASPPNNSTLSYLESKGT